MTKRRIQAIPASVAAVALIAEQAQATTGRPMPPAEMCELLTQARELEFHRLLEQPAPLSTPSSIRWSPAAFAALHGLTGTAAAMFTEIATAIQTTQENTPS